MIGWVTQSKFWFLVALGFWLSGCSPTAENTADEQSDSNFIAGRARKNNQDYPGAIEAFDKAIETNPRSAAAHFEAGLICYQYLADQATAIYHFRRFLQLRPNDAHADTVQQFINDAIQELARSVSLGAVSIAVQKQMNQLADENWKLKEKIGLLEAALARATNHTPAAAATLPMLTNRLPLAIATGAAPTSLAAAKEPSATTKTPRSPPKPAPAAAHAKPRGSEPATAAKVNVGRTHVVAAGESAEAIARRYGIRFSSLLVANPQLDPRRMRLGQALKIPAS